MAPASKGNHGGVSTDLGLLPGGRGNDAALPQDWLLIATPHLQLRGNSLFSIGVPGRGRVLSPPELELFKVLQQAVTVREALQRCGPAADLLIRDFMRERLFVLIEGSFPANRPRVLVIEPHADDAVLSVGGTMWLRRHERAFVIATMASRSNHTRYRDLGGNHDISDVTEIRRRESDLVARMLGGTHVSVGMTDAVLRYRDTEWTAEFYRRHRMAISASISRAADEAELRRWTEAVRRLVIEHQPTEIWFPLGGPHADHMLTTDSCFAAFAADRTLLHERSLRIYQEVPYAVRFSRHMRSALVAVKQSGAALQEETVPIEAVQNQKRRLSSVYDSQDMDELFEGGGDLPELFWKVTELPQHIAPRGIVSQAISAPTSAADALATWMARNRDASVIRVLLTTPAGRWQADLAVLSLAFPHARFEVWTASVAEAEVMEVPSARVVMRSVAGGTRAWLLHSLRLSLSRPAPTLLYASASRLPQARLVSRLWFGSDTVVLTSMDQLPGALRIATGER